MSTIIHVEQFAAIVLNSAAAFRRAALVGDRLALREAAQVAAGSLGVARDALMRNYIVETVPRLGLGHVEQVALARAGLRFREELFFKLAHLHEAHRDFCRRFGEPPNRIVSTVVPSAHRAIVH